MDFAPYLKHWVPISSAANQQNVLADEFVCVAEIMRMENAAGEFLETGEFGHVGRGEMAACHDHVVERLDIKPVVRQILHSNGELP
jgi:hypothetical protein